jgi:hypothetical protein
MDGDKTCNLMDLRPAPLIETDPMVAARHLYPVLVLSVCCLPMSRLGAAALEPLAPRVVNQRLTKSVRTIAERPVEAQDCDGSGWQGHS